MSNQNQIEHLPWGKFEILAQFKVEPRGDVCVKIITVKPKAKLSYQSHKQRSENWTFVQGQGTVVLNDVSKEVATGTRIYIPLGTKHRVINDAENQELVFVEVSTGHFDENDIERFDDDYGRA